MRPVLFTLFIGLLFLGNVFGAWKMISAKSAFFSKIPALTENLYVLMLVLPVLNLLALTGIWYWQKWGIYLAAVTSLAVIGLDLYLPVKYHLPVALLSTVLLAIGVIYYWKHFN